MRPNRLVFSVVVAAVVVLGAVAVVALAGTGSADDPDDARLLAAAGTAELRVDPDIATLRLGVTARRPRARTASDAASAAMTRVIAAARRVGVAQLESDPVRLHRARPRPSDADASSAERPFVARQAIRVRMSEFDAIDDLIDAAIAAGATTVVGPRFLLGDPGDARKRALVQAVADARSAARAMADAAGLRLGRIVRVEDRSGGGARPLAAVARSTATRTSAPIEPAAVPVDASVKVTFAIE